MLAPCLEGAVIAQTGSLTETPKGRKQDPGKMNKRRKEKTGLTGLMRGTKKAAAGMTGVEMKRAAKKTSLTSGPATSGPANGLGKTAGKDGMDKPKPTEMALPKKRRGEKGLQKKQG